MRRPPVLVLSLALPGLMLVPLGAATAVSTRAVAKASPMLNGVSAASPTDVWAIGHLAFHHGGPGSVPSRTLIEHWDGSSWKRMPSPSPGGRAGSGDLQAVSAWSGSAAWAVGSYLRGNSLRTLVARWDGDRWTQVPSPSPRRFCDLSAVTTVSVNYAWAVGECYQDRASKSLIARWDGSAWRLVESPSEARRTFLRSVSANGASDAWAVGRVWNRPFVEHWNGSEWAEVTPPDVPRGEFFGVTALSPTNIWAVGDYSAGHHMHALVEHWDGTSWQRLPLHGVDGRGDSSLLASVSATSPNDIWATGDFSLGTLIVHWDGSRWSRVAGPNPGRSENLFTGVSADASDDAWAVGLALDGRRASQLIAHWDGHTWTQQR